MRNQISGQLNHKTLFMVTTVVTSSLPMFDFVSDIFVTSEWLDSDDPDERFWGGKSLECLVANAALNVFIFGILIDGLLAARNIFGAKPLWHKNIALNVAIGAVLSATNFRAQCTAFLLMRHMIVKQGDDDASTLSQHQGSKDAGVSLAQGISAANAASIAVIRFAEFMVETIPELLLQSYAFTYKSYVWGQPLAVSTWEKASLAVSFVTLVVGLAGMFLWPNTEACVLVLGGLYILCMVFTKFAVVALLLVKVGTGTVPFIGGCCAVRWIYFETQKRATLRSLTGAWLAQERLAPRVRLVPKGSARAFVFEHAALLLANGRGRVPRAGHEPRPAEDCVPLTLAGPHAGQALVQLHEQPCAFAGVSILSMGVGPAERAARAVTDGCFVALQDGRVLDINHGRIAAGNFVQALRADSEARTRKAKRARAFTANADDGSIGVSDRPGLVLGVGSDAEVAGSMLGALPAGALIWTLFTGVLDMVPTFFAPLGQADLSSSLVGEERGSLATPDGVASRTIAAIGTTCRTFTALFGSAADLGGVEAVLLSRDALGLLLVHFAETAVAVALLYSGFGRSKCCSYDGSALSHNCSATSAPLCPAADAAAGNQTQTRRPPTERIDLAGDTFLGMESVNPIIGFVVAPFALGLVILLLLWRVQRPLRRAARVSPFRDSDG